MTFFRWAYYLGALVTIFGTAEARAQTQGELADEVKSLKAQVQDLKATAAQATKAADAAQAAAGSAAANAASEAAAKAGAADSSIKAAAAAAKSKAEAAVGAAAGAAKTARGAGESARADAEARIKAAKDQADATVKAAREQAEATVRAAKADVERQLKAARDEAKQQALDTINSTKYVHLTFGVLPNSDHKANNIVDLTVNYQPELSTSARYENRNFSRSATLSSTIPASGDLPEFSRSAVASTALEETKVELMLIRYQPTRMQFGQGAFQPSFGLGIDHMRTNSSRFLVDRQTFADPRSGTPREVIMTVQIKEQRVATLPNLNFDLKGKVGSDIDLGVGAGLFFANRETYSWEERGSGSMPGLTVDASTGSEIAGQTVDLHDNRRNDFRSNGFKTHLDLAYEIPNHGFSLRNDFLSKQGRRTSYALNIASEEPDIDPATSRVRNPNAKTISTTESSIEEKLVQVNTSLGWKLRFLKRYGIVPELAFAAGMDHLVTKNDGVKESEVSKHYAFGVLLDY